MQNSKFKKRLPVVAFFILILLSLFAYFKKDITVLDQENYERLLDSGEIKEAKIVESEVILKDKNSKLYSIIIDGVDLKELLKSVPISVESGEDYSLWIVSLLLFLISFYLFFKLFDKRDEKDLQEYKREEVTSFAGEEYQFKKRISAVETDVTFRDVAGIESVKDELKEIVDFIKNPKKYRDFGIKLPKGVLLVGPPGVGKTLIAKAVAGEAETPFFYQSAASFVHIYVGMGAKRVKELFDSAKRSAPSIIFIDELDAVGKSRGVVGQNDEREATLNQLLTEMDGFEDSSGVVVIAATNQIETIDEALLRSGRFDRRIHISLPNVKEREEILKVHLKDKRFNLDLIEVAKMSVGFSGADLATFVNEAALKALKRGSDEIELRDFEAVKDRVLFGERAKKSFLEEEKRILATYNGAKALSAYWFDVEFDKVTLLDGSFGVADREIESKTRMLNRLKVYLSGRVATLLKYDEVYSNAKDDIKAAKMLSSDMVEKYGMGDDIIASHLDSSIIIDEATERVREFLEKSSKALERVERALLEDEFITKSKVKEIVDEVL
jgi:ATP-dependent metalloprotease FtsH